MLGDVLGESKGKRIVRRVLSSDPLKVEVSFEDTGTMLGVATNGMGTYTSEARPDGSLYGEGQGAMIKGDGEPITWRGSGAGKLLPGGALSYRGILSNTRWMPPATPPRKSGSGSRHRGQTAHPKIKQP